MFVIIVGGSIVKIILFSVTLDYIHRLNLRFQRGGNAWICLATDCCTSAGAVTRSVAARSAVSWVYMQAVDVFRV